MEIKGRMQFMPFHTVDLNGTTIAKGDTMPVILVASMKLVD